MKRVFLLVILFSLEAVLLRAQLADDVRVSPPDSDNYVMPLDARIESSTVIGDVRLVVWGTTVNDGQDSLVNVLRMQILRDTVILGTQRSLTGNNARPYGFVRVIPLIDRFIVIWNDSRKGEEGIYSRLVGMDGTLLAEERKLSSACVLIGSMPSEIVLGDPAQGILLSWEGDKSSPGIHALRIDRSGTIRSAEQHLGDTLHDILTYAALPGLYLMRFDDTGKIIHPDGTIDPRNIPSGRLVRQFQIGSDTSMAAIVDSDLIIYHNIHDVLPARKIAISALDSAFRGIALVTRDSMLHYHIFFPVVQVTKGGTGERRVTFYRMDPDDSVTRPIPWLSNVVANVDTRDHDVYDYGDAWLTSGCSNSALITISFARTSYYHGEPLPQQDSIWLTFSLGEDGVLKYDQEFGGMSGGPKSVSTYYRADCVPQSLDPVVRIEYERSSAVRDSSRKGSPELSAAVGHLGVNLPQFAPGIMLVNDTLVVLWRHASHSFHLANWISITDTAIIRDRLSIDTLPPYAKPSWGSYQKIYTYLNQVQDAMPVFDGGGIVTVFRERNQTNQFQEDPFTSIRDEVTLTNSMIFLPGATRWLAAANKSAFSSAVEYWNNVLPILYMQYVGWDPNHRIYLVRIFSSDLTIDSLIALDSDGYRVWSAKHPILGQATLPIDVGSYLSITRDTVRRIGGKDAKYFSIAHGDTNAMYRRLLGDRFLRYVTRLDTVFLESWDLDGHVVGTIDLPLDSVAGTPAIIEDPRDSSLIVLYVHDGLRVAHVDKRFGWIFSDRLASAARSGIAHPSGTLRHDTLFVVWEDTRNGTQDIYGNYLYLASQTDSVQHALESMDQGLAIGEIYPVPARNLIHVNCRIPSNALLDLFDPVGRLVKEVRIDAASAGVQQFDVRIDAAIEGVYLLRIRSAAAVAFAKFLVLR